MAAHITDTSFQEPFPYYEIIFFADRTNLKYIKLEFAHGGGILVAFFVVLQRVLIAFGNPGFPDKHQPVIIPIPLHKGWDIASIPGLTLCFQQI